MPPLAVASGDEVVIVSTKPNSGGVKLKVGKSYRINALYMDTFPLGSSHRYFTFKALVVPLTKKDALLPAENSDCGKR